MPSLDELRAVFLARDMKDGEVGACGLAAPIPMAAMRLAQETHAPNLTISSEGGVNPRPSVLVEVPIDPRGTNGIEYVSDLYDMFIKAEHGLDFWFMSGVQTDRFGNINLHLIGGSREHPRFRGPGVGNVSYAATAGRWYNYASAHSPRTFVDKVDFLTALGNTGGVVARRATAPGYGDGCRFVVSNLGVMDFDEYTGEMRLLHVHPGVTAEQVVAATGFPLSVPTGVTETPEPTQEELEILRRVVDPSGVLRQERAR